jgi:predicted phosphodiesterase
MKIQIVSDIHAEKHADHGKTFADLLDPAEVDVLVVAGDVGGVPQLAVTIPLLCAKYPHVVFVVGNHEHLPSGSPRTP